MKRFHKNEGKITSKKVLHYRENYRYSVRNRYILEHATNGNTENDTTLPHPIDLKKNDKNLFRINDKSEKRHTYFFLI